MKQIVEVSGEGFEALKGNTRTRVAYDAARDVLRGKPLAQTERSGSK